MLKDLGLIYLATPYSKFPDGLEAAHEAASRIAGALVMRGAVVYCPIAHTHPIAVHGELDPYDHEIWLEFDRVMLERCDTLLVAEMAGWDQSKGITFELGVFWDAGKPAYALDPGTLEIRLLPKHKEAGQG